MSNRVITISREFGSGGRTIGRKVAEKLGIPCYDAKKADMPRITSGRKESMQPADGSPRFLQTEQWE